MTRVCVTHIDTIAGRENEPDAPVEEPMAVGEHVEEHRLAAPLMGLTTVYPSLIAYFQL